MLTVKRTKKGISIRLTEFPNVDELVELNSLGSNDYFMDDSRGYDRLLVSAQGDDVLPCVMECPINETFRD